jgi:hypothetical protein
MQYKVQIYETVNEQNLPAFCAKDVFAWCHVHRVSNELPHRGMEVACMNAWSPCLTDLSGMQS